MAGSMLAVICWSAPAVRLSYLHHFHQLRILKNVSSKQGGKALFFIMARSGWCQSTQKMKVKQCPLSLIDESRIAVILKQLQAKHEKFCPWPDFPCPGRSKCCTLRIYIYIYILSNIIINLIINMTAGGISERFWLVAACEPSALLTAFLERFQSACLLAQQLPAMKPEQLKSMVSLAVCVSSNYCNKESCYRKVDST